MGDGQGLSKVRSTLSGMFIFRGGEIFFLGGVSICKGGGNAAAGVVSSTSDWNAILIAVLGNRKVHLLKVYYWILFESFLFLIIQF